MYSFLYTLYSILCTTMAIISDFGVAFLFLIGAVIFVTVTLLVAKLIRPHRPNPEKLTSYECGEDPIGSAWTNFNIRFYVVALIFVLFDIEVVFLFPWATVFGKADLVNGTGGLWGLFSLVEMGIFLLILALGLAFAWRKGFLEWEKPTPPALSESRFRSPVPFEKYEQLNERYAGATKK